MQLKFKSSHLIEALGIVSIVESRALTAQQNSAAYLFNCFRRPDGQPWVHIYSRSQDQVARAGFALDELDGEGQFTFPTHPIRMFNNIPDDVITIDSTTETKSDGQAFVLNVRSSSGMKWDHSTYDPRLIAPCDKDFDVAAETAKLTYSVGVMRTALGLARPFLPGADRKDDVDEHFNAVQIFDQSDEAWSKGDGHMFCSDSTRAFYFQSSAFENKGFAIHSRHMGKLADFLGKCTASEVNICKGQNMTYAINGNEDQILGWVHQVKTHKRFAYIPPVRDKYVLRIPKATLLNALDTAGIAIDPKQESIRFVYTHINQATGGHTVHFTASESSGKFESFPVSTFDKVGEPSLEENIDFLVKLKDFKSLFSDASGNEVELRIIPIPKDDHRPRGGAMLRTFDDLTLDGNGKIIADKPTSSEEPGGESKPEARFKCKVTRFMPSTV